MIESLSIENFRAFKKVEVHDLQRLNVVVGRNATGKTALGEALYLAASASPLANWWLRAIRNRVMPEQQTLWNRTMFEDFWKDWFHNFHQDQTIRLSFVDSYRGQYTVRIYYDHEAQPLRAIAAPLPSLPAVPLVFEREGPNGIKSISKVLLDKNAPAFEGPLEPIPRVLAVPSTGVLGQGDMVAAYSDLSKKGEEGSVLAALQRVFPEVRDLTIALDATLPSLYAKVDSVDGLLPIGVVSSGVAKVLSILLAVASTREGVVLVDEIENGIHYSKLPVVWQALSDLCDDCESQVFAATHSWECLEAVRGILKEHRDGFCLLRTERRDGTCTVSQYSGSKLAAALEEEVDVR